MKLVFLILKMHFKSASSALRNDTRMKITWFITLSLSWGISLWSISQLLYRVSQWQSAGPTVLETRLWLLCFGAWVGIGLLTALSTMTLGFGDDQPRLLMILPIPIAARFRTLYGLMFFEGIGNWLLLEAIVIGVPLTMILGLQAFKWLLLVLLGVAVAVWMSIVVMLLMIRYVLPHLKKELLVVPVSCAGIGIIYLALHIVGITPHLSVFPMPEPLHVSLLLLRVLVLVVGPCADFTGKLYEEAFHEMEGRSRSRSVINLPGVRLLSKWLRQHRNLTGALLVKGLLNQSRNTFTWGRAVMVLVCIALFPFARTLLAPYRFSNMLLVVIYSSGLAILAMIDYAPYAISSEGTRLGIYLVIPLKVETYMRTRLIVFLIPILFMGLTLSLVFSWWMGLTVFELVQVVLIVSLILSSYTAFSVLGSVWDEDLNLVSEGMMPVLSQEELPFTPRRLQLLGLSMALIAAMFFLVWKLPASLSMPALILLDGIVLTLGWRFGSAQMRGLIIRG